MKNYLIALIIFTLFGFLCLSACSTSTSMQNETNSTCDKVTYVYTRTNDNGQAIDSLKLCTSNYETTLDFYKNVDSLSQSASGIIYMSIFKIEDQKFAILVDYTTKVYKFTGNKFEKIQHIDCSIGSAEISQNKLDINADRHTDVVIEIPTGGAYGSDFIFLFYNSDLKTLEYDKNAKMRNCEIDLKLQQVRCNYNWSSTLFAIDKYGFRKLESYTYLRFVSDNPKVKKMTERTIYSKAENIIQIDTIANE